MLRRPRKFYRALNISTEAAEILQGPDLFQRVSGTVLKDLFLKTGEGV
jgi:hypothetical protein